jgi:pyridoxine 5-phosphate synthase
MNMHPHRDILLGVNVDHVATLRQARGGAEPDPVTAALMAELAGADGITVHLREDRRHIQERDVRILRQVVQTRLNLEMAIDPAIVEIARDIKPDCATLVPEKRRELTTEGGLDVAGHTTEVRRAVKALQARDIIVSLFIDPAPAQVQAAARTGAEYIEIHTGRYAEARGRAGLEREQQAIAAMAALAVRLGLRVNAGHGLNYRNVGPVAAVPVIAELNIGHAILARAVLTGLPEAVREMKRLMTAVRLPQTKTVPFL